MFFDNVSYGIGLSLFEVAALTTAMLCGHGQLLRSASAIFCNWIFGTVFVELTGITDCWQFNIPLDLATAIVILWRPAGRVQAILGATYAIQIAMHGGYGAAKLDLFGAGVAADKWSYYDALTAVAWLQLLILGGWCIGVWRGGTAGRWFGPRRKAVVAPDRSGMGVPR